LKQNYLWKFNLGNLRKKFSNASKNNFKFKKNSEVDRATFQAIAEPNIPQENLKP